MSDAGAVQERVVALYGDIDLARYTGVVHVVAVCEAVKGELSVIRIGPAAPKSATDSFVLQLARARADAIIVTGKILRDEPSLRYDLPRDLLAWRREHAGLGDPAKLIVLTRGDDFDATHPALHGWARAVVFTTETSAERLRNTQVDAVGHVDPSLRTAIDWAVGEGARVVSIEAGPSSASSLYRARIAVDEIMLSEFLGELAPAARGGVLLRRDDLEAALRLSAAPREFAEESGLWRFARWTRDQRISPS